MMGIGDWGLGLRGRLYVGDTQKHTKTNKKNKTKKKKIK